MNNPFAAPAPVTSSASSRGGRRSEEVRRRSGGGNHTDHLLPTYREGGGGGGGQPTLFPIPSTRKAKKPTATITEQPCPTCRQPTLQAQESDSIPIHNTADPHTLNPRDELDALLAGRHTYEHNHRTQTLGRRTIHHIRGRPPNTHTDHTVHPQHTCWTQPLGTPPAPPQPAPTRKTTTNDQPPF